MFHCGFIVILQEMMICRNILLKLVGMWDENCEQTRMKVAMCSGAKCIILQKFCKLFGNICASTDLYNEHFQKIFTRKSNCRCVFCGVVICILDNNSISIAKSTAFRLPHIDFCLFVNRNNFESLYGFLCQRVYWATKKSNFPQFKHQISAKKCYTVFNATVSKLEIPTSLIWKNKLSGLRIKHSAVFFVPKYVSFVQIFRSCRFNVAMLLRYRCLKFSGSISLVEQGLNAKLNRINCLRCW